MIEWPPFLRFLLTIAALLAAGCAGPQVRSVGHGGAAAYAVHGESAAQLRAEARRLCPAGYVVLRQAVSSTVPDTSDDAWGRAFVVAGQWLAGQPFDLAQATIVCQG
jgi:hypothetical protein